MAGRNTRLSAAPSVTAHAASSRTLVVSGLAIFGAWLAASGQLTIATPWIDTIAGEDKWSNVALYLRFFAEYPIYGTVVFCLCALV